MKRIVVVTNKEKLVFSGDDLRVSDNARVLFVRDGNEQKAVFKDWEYWREIGENEKILSTNIRKVIIRPSMPYSKVAWRKLLVDISRSQIVPIPHDFSIFLIYDNGEIEKF